MSGEPVAARAGGTGPASGDVARTLVRDRASGALFVERVFSERALRLLYEGTAGRLLTPLLARSRWPSRVYGWWQRRSWTRRRIPGFVAALGVDASEAERPLSGYRSLDEFFSRRLRPDARPVDGDPANLVAPCDGRVLVEPRLAGAIRVKCSAVTTGVLLGDDRAARRFEGGAAVIFRLAPADYHRFHFPDSGVASAVTRLPGHLHAVHPIALAAGAPSFRNQRAITWLETAAFGTVAIVEIGALVVGSIVQTSRPGPVERGAEKGYFRFGGSTIVLLVEPGRVDPDADLVEASAAGYETLVRMGTRIGRIHAPAPGRPSGSRE